MYQPLHSRDRPIPLIRMRILSQPITATLTGSAAYPVDTTVNPFGTHTDILTSVLTALAGKSDTSWYRNVTMGFAPRQAFGLVIAIALTYLVWAFLTEPLLFGVILPQMDTSSYNGATVALWSLLKPAFAIGIVGFFCLAVMKASEG